MDIYILHDGKQIGPFSEGTTHQMLKQGVVLINDPAWRPGMAEWIPLHSVLYPAAVPTESAAPEIPAEPSPTEYATAKQRAFPSYMGISFPADLSKEQGGSPGELNAMENPTNASRVERWNDERLKRYPEVFAAEIQAKKEERPQRFYELCQTEGAEALEGVTKAHCQVLVGYLDEKFPNWDSRKETEATWNYFFPAVAEKFPQLVRAGWKEKLKYVQEQKAAPEPKRRAPAAPTRAAAPKRKQSSPVASLFKGLVFGLLLVGLAVGGLYAYYHPEVVEQAKAQIATFQAKLAKKTPASDSAVVAPAATPAPANQDTQSLFSDAPKATTESAPTASMTPSATSSQPASTSPGMATTAPGESGTMNSAPAPTMPEASSTPNNSSSMSLFDPAPSSSGDTMAKNPAAGSALPQAKTTVRLVQPLELQLTYGKIKVPAGTQLPIVEQDGMNLKVQFQNQIVSVPISATDLGEDGQQQ